MAIIRNKGVQIHIEEKLTEANVQPQPSAIQRPQQYVKILRIKFKYVF